MPSTARLAALLSCAALLAPSAEAGACSISRFEPWSYERATFFIASALPDTLPAGPGGKVFYSHDPRRAEPLQQPEWPIHGQVMRLVRTGGYAADSVARVAERFGSEVVVVPWDRRGDCMPVASEGGRLVPPGRNAFLSVALRDPEHWVRGRPTFDADIGAAYTGPDEEYPPTTADSALTLDRLFEVHTVLRPFEEFERDPERAAEPLLAWVRANPDVRRSGPIVEMLRMSMMFTEDARVSRIVPPMAGTYRLSIVTEGASPRELLIRTKGPPTPWLAHKFAFREDGEEEHDPLEPGEGYALKVRGAGLRGMGSCREGEVGIIEQAVPDGRGGDQWRAELSWLFLRSCFPRDATIEAAVAAYDRTGGGRDPLPGTFTRAPDGTIRFHQVLRVEGRVLMEVTGERVGP